MNSPHLLVIGGTGFIGHHLLRASHQRDWKMTSVSLNPPPKERFVDDVCYLNFDMTDSSLVKKYLDKDYDYVVNLGGYINHKLFKDGGGNLIDTHFITIQNLVEVLPRNKLKRFVQIGSSDEYGDNVAPQNESQREAPISPYSFAKSAATHFLQMLYRTEGFPVVILRPFLVYGVGQDDNRFIPQIIQGCINNNKFPVSAGEQLRDFCHIDDISNAIFLALSNNNAHGEVINIASGVSVSIKDVISLIKSLIGSGKPQFGLVPYRVGENMKLFADISKAKRILGWSPKVNLVDGLKKVIDQYAEH